MCWAHLAELRLRVHHDLADLTLEALARHADAALAAQPLVLADASRRHFASAPGQNVVTLQDQFVLRAWGGEQQDSGFGPVLISNATDSKVKEETLVPLLCASIWETELTVTLQTGQWRWALLCLGSLSSSVRCSPFALAASTWLTDSAGGAAVSAASETSAVPMSEPASDSCEEGEI